MRLIFVLLALAIGVFGVQAHAQSGDSRAPELMDGYGLKLQSTVGLGPNCADSQNLVLPAAPREVTVCLEAFNVTDSTLYLHDVVSERLGTLVSAELYTLPANSSILYTYALSLDRSAALVSRWIAANESGPIACAVSWSLVQFQSRLRPPTEIPLDTTLVCP